MNRKWILPLLLCGVFLLFHFGGTVSADDGEGFTSLTDHLCAVRFQGDDCFQEFLSAGGASSDADVAAFLTSRLSLSDALSFSGSPFGCSTIAAKSPEGERLFGRNFDWDPCEALIVLSKPDTGYASISTVNTDFIDGSGVPFDSLPDQVKSLIALYAPLDGMNEKGLCVSVNMIQDSDTIEQNTDLPDLTTTTAVRLLLNQAADADEALELLKQYDFHASMGMMVHLAIADAKGNSLAVEYVNNEMKVIETSVLTNFYLAEGEKQGIGTSQSHTRYDILEETLSSMGTLDMEALRDSLASVSKKNFSPFESTQWSIVFNQTTGTVRYYHRENYDDCFEFSLKEETR